jgi:hypothetical protein
MTRPDRDPVADAISRALKATGKACQTANEDTRTSSSDAAYALQVAYDHLKIASTWMHELKAEEAADEKPTKPKTPPEPEPEQCAACEEPIEPNDVSICESCGKPICPDCMGEDGVCCECEEETT